MNFIRFKNESLVNRLAESSKEPHIFQQNHIIFGGTGAIGGQVVIEMIELYEDMIYLSGREKADITLVATGKGQEDIDHYLKKLKQAFAKSWTLCKMDSIPLVSDQQGVLVERPSGIQVKLYPFDARPSFKEDLLSVVVAEDSLEENLSRLRTAVSHINSPFKDFLNDYYTTWDLPDEFRFRSAISGIPIPSVAAYHMSQIDKILRKLGVNSEKDRTIERSVKSLILKTIAEEFGVIKGTYAEEVLVAHTTSVGGMFTIENGEPVIHLGYAHSSLGDLLTEKQYYANALTEKYSQLGLKTLITAAAVGINNIHSHRILLPISNNLHSAFWQAQENDELPFGTGIFKGNKKCYNHVFPYQEIAAHPNQQNEDSPLHFPAQHPLEVQFALESGENGLFSIDNTWALYLNMKISMQEELAHILTFNALFGDDRQRPWFDDKRICYREESDNSLLIFSLLGNNEQFIRYQISGFTPKAFQDLGSSKHQGELHTLGIYILLHRLSTLDIGRISDITCKYEVEEAMEFVDKNSQPLMIEDVSRYDPWQTALRFRQLLNLQDPRELARFVGYKLPLEENFIRTFFKNLLRAIHDTISTITSLGTPIVYRDAKGNDRIFAGPYMAPANLVISKRSSFVKYIAQLAEEYQIAFVDLYNWTLTNNGFIDLRPEASMVTAKSYREDLRSKIFKFTEAGDFRQAVNTLPRSSYFTSSGILAFTQRMQGLDEHLASFNLQLGSYNKWKALFRIDTSGNHIVMPGVVEAMRMYSEGLGKVTGTELLYPLYGYFPRA